MSRLSLRALPLALFASKQPAAELSRESSIPHFSSRASSFFRKLSASGRSSAGDTDFRRSQGRASTQDAFSFEGTESSEVTANDSLYTDHLAFRAVPVNDFLKNTALQWVLPITSINEDRLLKELGLPRDERDQIEGLHQKGQKLTAEAPKLKRKSSFIATGASLLLDIHIEKDGHAADRVSSEQLRAMRAGVRLALDPPADVGELQRRTAGWHVRPFPLGLRFSGKNMSPLPGWLAGAQHVA